jgi:hypothetical protein
MMGLLFTLFLAGLGLGAVLALRPAWRSRAPLALIPMMASMGSCGGAWGGALSIGGVGFFGGYVVGGVLGASAGWRVARQRGAIGGTGPHDVSAPTP